MPAFDKPLPANYTIQTLALWLDAIDIGDHVGMARRVRALLEDVATRTARDVANGPFVTEREIPSIVSRVLGSPS